MHLKAIFLESGLARFLFVFTLCGFAFLWTCRQSQFLRKRYIDFNFRDEGFLSPSLLQTLAYASYQSGKVGSRNDERMCLELAQRKARKRLLRVILHLYFNIDSKSRLNKKMGEQSVTKHSFNTDYPFSFSADEFLRAELAFNPILRKAFIALQDSRDPKRCMIVYRVKAKDLSQEIQNLKVNFKIKPK